MITGLDWSGPNKAWSLELMRLLAQEVMRDFASTSEPADPKTCTVAWPLRFFGGL